MKKYFFFSLIFIVYYRLSIFAQADKPTEKPSIDKEYADTVFSEEAPVPINIQEVYKMINYPEKAIRWEIGGKVLIKLLVDHSGNIEKTGDISGPSIFYDEVKRVAVKLKFTPGKVNDYPVKVWVTVPFNFQLKK